MGNPIPDFVGKQALSLTDLQALADAVKGAVLDNTNAVTGVVPARGAQVPELDFIVRGHPEGIQYKGGHIVYLADDNHPAQVIALGTPGTWTHSGMPCTAGASLIIRIEIDMESDELVSAYPLIGDSVAGPGTPASGGSSSGSSAKVRYIDYPIATLLTDGKGVLIQQHHVGAIVLPRLGTIAGGGSTPGSGSTPGGGGSEPGGGGSTPGGGGSTPGGGGSTPGGGGSTPGGGGCTCLTYEFDPEWFTVTVNNNVASVTLNTAKLDAVAAEIVNGISVDVTVTGLSETTQNGTVSCSTTASGTADELTANTNVSMT